MFVRETDLFMNRITQALSKPIQSRCAELTVLFDRGSISELQALFPILIDNIFGPQGSFDWSLRTTSCNINSQDFQALQHFLSPFGPLFRLIYNLLVDPLIKYEFSVAYLPSKIRQMLESSNSHPFYSDLIHVNPQTKQITSLLLNPFDYYFFHFAYYLINPWHQRTGAVFGASWNTVYYALCCDYILHFLPSDANTPVLPVINFYCGKNPIQPLPSFNKQTRQSKLLRSTLFSETLNEYQIHQNLDRHPRNEIWRSETVLVVFTDMWLNNDQINTSQSFPGNTSRQPIQYNELPTGEYVRIIRVLVKHLHAFAASAKADDTHMGEIKKVTTSIFQGKMYIFLRNLVHRWPLDGSFRLVLELWLSFIQPWRYAQSSYVKNSTQQDVNQELEDLGTAPMKSVEPEYMQFIAENLLAYVVIFQQLLPRFSRIDLASPKMSLMLYRLTKVFDQPNLVTYLREIEGSINSYNHSPTHTYHNQWNSSLPPLSPTSIWSTNTFSQESTPPRNTMYDTNVKLHSKWSTIVRQKMFELEGPSFCYKPLFTKQPAQEVYELINQLKMARDTAHSIIKARIEEEKKQSSGFLGFIKAALLLTDGSSDEFTLVERKKVPVYLDFALQNLMDMFEIPTIFHETSTSTETSSKSGFSIADNLLFLTPERVKDRIKHMKYEGDPDLFPVCSYENHFLVTFFYRLSTAINEACRPQIERLYFQENYLGKLTRQLICPPMTAYKYDKFQEGRSQRIAVHLPPRISLRPLANYKFLAYMIIGALISNFIGYSASTFVFVVFFIWFFIQCLKAIPRERTNTTGNYSINLGNNSVNFNESFN